MRLGDVGLDLTGVQRRGWLRAKAASVVETVSGPNPWAVKSEKLGGSHCCYFCQPESYPEMFERHTLCARCGQLIFTPDIPNDPMNEAMVVCEKCDEEMLL